MTDDRYRVLEINGRFYESSTIAARRAGVSLRYIAHLAKRGRLPAKKIGHDWYIEDVAVNAFIQQRSQKTAQRRRGIGESDVMA